MKTMVMQQLAVIEKDEFDVFFSHRWASNAFLCHLHALLTKLGRLIIELIFVYYSTVIQPYPTLIFLYSSLNAHITVVN